MPNRFLMTAPTPSYEEERLAELTRRGLLDTPPEVVFDRLTRLAAKRFAMPIALISLVDESRQWFKSKVGLEVNETARELAFCAHAILGDEVMVVHDTHRDPRFVANPLVTGEPNIRFYAGAPLVTRQGYALGTICVIDRVAHPEFGEEQKRELAELAAIAMGEIDLRQAISRTRNDLAALQKAQRELREIREQADRAAHEKSQFIANISHELRTPMNGILGMAYLMADTKLDAVQREYIDTINHSAQNLLLLLNDVLDLSKIEAGELIIDKTAFDIKTSFLQTIKLLKPLADKKSNRLEIIIDDTTPDSLVGDPVRFAQIITNLVGNAIKFTDNGVVEARLSYLHNRHEVACEIIDTGIGIPKEKQSAIFEKFVQGNAAITQKYGGTGLGLAITKQLVVMLGGEIQFESTEGKGSRFWFRLPATKPKKSPVRLVRVAAKTNGRDKKLASTARLIIAEDHPVNQLFLCKVLRKFGFATIDVADDGAKLLAMMDDDVRHGRAPYDAIFMDCMMPEMDGYEATRRLRHLEEVAGGKTHIPIIAMTANALLGDREACYEVGMDEYLSKPLQPEKLQQVLAQWFTFEGDGPALSVCEKPVREAAAVVAQVPIDFARVSMVADQVVEQRELLQLFFRLADEYTKTMQYARRDAEFENWKSAVHSLKGTAANLGMEPLVALCREAETSPEGGYDQRSTLLEKIRLEIGVIRSYLALRHPELGLGT